MLQLLVLALAAGQLASAQHVHSYQKFPVNQGHETECYDAQVGKYFPVGESWATTTNACKRSQCIKEGDVIYIDRVSCDPVKELLALLKKHDSTWLCREAAGNRRKPLPGCCPQVICKKRSDYGLVRIPKSEFPVFPDQILYE